MSQRVRQMKEPWKVGATFLAKGSLSSARLYIRLKACVSSSKSRHLDSTVSGFLYP